MTVTKRMGNIDGNDVMVFLGMCALGVGIGMLSVPVALMVVGGLLMALGLFGAITKSTGRRK